MATSIMKKVSISRSSQKAKLHSSIATPKQARTGVAKQTNSNNTAEVMSQTPLNSDSGSRIQGGSGCCSNSDSARVS